MDANDLSKDLLEGAAENQGQTLRNHTGHAIVMPQCISRRTWPTGGGELGGLGGLCFHMLCTTVQAPPAVLRELCAKRPCSGDIKLSSRHLHYNAEFFYAPKVSQHIIVLACFFSRNRADAFPFVNSRM